MADIIPPISSRMSNIIQALLPAAAAAATDHTFNYPVGLGGDPSLMKSISKNFNKYFRPAIPITSDHLVTACGAGFYLDAIASCIFEPGDSILVPGPCWSSYRSVGAYLYCHAGVTMVPAYPSPLSTALTSETLLPALETAYNSSPDPKRIKGLLIFNPHAPFGQYYSKSVLQDLLEWSSNKGLHYISDEVYGFWNLDVTRKPKRAKSMFFGARANFAVCPESSCLILCFVLAPSFRLTIKLPHSLLFSLPTYSTPIYCHLLLNKNNALLSKNYTLLSSTLNHLGIEFLPVNAGFFVFAKLSIDSETRKEEAVVKKSKEFKVMVSPGKQFGGAENEKGWARITIAVPEEEFKEGIKRIWICFGEILSQQNKSMCTPTHLNFKKNT
ncbi:hypothetical protein BTUL_0184g00180 [Botrytis tulipae]|uniref:Aminotransferase class I/classII large domain-containing protein n=1 Tax=Botrytis tulipae TaxID=87230 RepID=A0A4Z1EHY8_9HELO|nr:hypothetical protein BTUL_0184g00180 [Botrytis tulipae]